MHELDLKLQAHLHFSDTDLEANRAEQLSQPQFHKVQGLYRLSMLGSAFFAIWAVIALLSLPFTFRPPLSWLVSLCTSTPAFIVAAFLVVRVFPLYQGYRRDLKANMVIHVTGVVRKRMPPSEINQLQRYELIVRDRIFRVNSKRYAAFEDGQRYTIYFTPFSRMIVAAEWISDIAADMI